MKPQYKSTLIVNKKAIEMNPFVESFVANVAAGMVQSLKGVDYLNSIRIRQDKGEVNVEVNGEEIDLTPFPNDLIISTLAGLLAPLKGVENIQSLEIQLNVQR